MCVSLETTESGHRHVAHIILHYNMLHVIPNILGVSSQDIKYLGYDVCVH